MKRLIILVLVLSFSVPFVSAQKKPKPKPNVPTPDTLDRTGPASTPDPRTLADVKWFDIFQDEQLRELVREALVYNHDVRSAVARVNMARANYGIVRSAVFPEINASGEVITEHRSRDGAVDIPEPVSQNRQWGNILLNFLSWELDFFGRRKKEKQAARADLLATEEARLAIVITLIGDIATAY